MAGTRTCAESARGKSEPGAALFALIGLAGLLYIGIIAVISMVNYIGMIAAIAILYDDQKLRLNAAAGGEVSPA